MPVYKATITIVALFEADNDEMAQDMLRTPLAQLVYEIEDGDWTGTVNTPPPMVVPPDKVTDELHAIGTDPLFFNGVS